MVDHILLALSLTATVYGTGEQGMCGDPETPVACAVGATTASGEPFLPDEVPSAAVPLPRKQRLRVKELKIRHTVSGNCVTIRINDKSNERWIGVRGLDLTPAALSAIGIKPTKYWSGRVEACNS